MITITIDDIYNIIRPCGLAPKKSKAIWDLSHILVEKYNSNVPESFEDLEEKIEGLYNPQEIILNRILEELQNPDIKYHIFVDTK